MQSGSGSVIISQTTLGLSQVARITASFASRQVSQVLPVVLSISITKMAHSFGLGSD